MSVDHERLEGVRRTLAADDYRLEVTVDDGSAAVAVVAGPSACADCLVPKRVMRSMLAPMLGVPEDRIELAYPADAAAS